MYTQVFVKMENKEPVNDNVKRKRVWVSIADKVEILKRLDSGEKQSDLAAAFGISRPTVTQISRNRNQIMFREQVLTSEQGSTKKKKYTGQEESCLEKIVFSWFTERRAEGISTSGPCLREFAKSVNEKLGGPSSFKASNGWLYSFKRRHGIKHFGILEEKQPSDNQVIKDVCHDIREFVEKEGYLEANVYNVDESGLQWKRLPDKTLESGNESQESKREVDEDRVTIMICANSTGTHKLPLLLIGKEEEHRYSRNENADSCVYVSQKNALMDKKVFLDWYTNVFVKSVRTKRNEGNDNFLLILDNAPPHLSEAELNMIDPCCKVKFLPTNATSLIHPKHQGVIMTLKTLYKISFLREFLLSDNESEEFLKSWTLDKCFEKLGDAWECVSEGTLQQSWNNIFRNNAVNQMDEDVDRSEIKWLATKAEKKNFNANDIQTWLDIDKYDDGWQVRSIDEIKPVMDPGDETLGEEIDKLKVEDSKDSINLNESDEVTCHEALISANKLYKWYSSRWDANPESLKHLAFIKELASSVTVDTQLRT